MLYPPSSVDRKGEEAELRQAEIYEELSAQRTAWEVGAAEQWKWKGG